MPRPARCRRICREPAYDSFFPEGLPGAGPLTLSLDEFEVIRLVDLERLTHAQCGEQMGISRTTVTEIYETARHKLADCLVNGRPLRISGGNYQLCPGAEGAFCDKACPRKGQNGGDPPAAKGAHEMRIAVCYENGQVFQHFGHTEQFLLCDVENGQIVKKSLVDTQGSGHGALAGLLAQLGVDCLICGGIGGGARTALDAAGIQLFGGVSGDAEAAAKALVEGELRYNPAVACSHHDHEHGEVHSCGSHGCGQHGHEEGHGCGQHHCGE